MSVAFTKEDSAATAAETMLPDRPVSGMPNLVTATGLAALHAQLDEARTAIEALAGIDDVDEKRRQEARPLRDLRYLNERIRTAQLVPDTPAGETLAFGNTVSFTRNEGRVQKYRIVGEDEADPGAGLLSYASPVAQLLLGRAVGEIVASGDNEWEIIAIS